MSGYTIKRQGKIGTFEFMCITWGGRRRRETVSRKRNEKFLNAMKSTPETHHTHAPFSQVNAPLAASFHVSLGDWELLGRIEQ